VISAIGGNRKAFVSSATEFQAVSCLNGCRFELPELREQGRKSAEGGQLRSRASNDFREQNDGQNT